uniref:Uncharacterized protein n=1 Tax=Arundo donax TaxID=35708 RepID=A0A0A8ZEZ4_ARUDO
MSGGGARVRGSLPWTWWTYCCISPTTRSSRFRSGETASRDSLWTSLLAARTLRR